MDKSKDLTVSRHIELSDNNEYAIEQDFKRKKITGKIAFFIILFIYFIFVVVFFSNRIDQNKIKQMNRQVLSQTQHNKQINWGAYMQQVEKKIKSNWHPPREGLSQVVIVKFTIWKNGEVSNIEVLKSSNISAVDKAAMNAIKLSSPFKPLPKEYQKKSVPIEFTFSYNVIKY